MKVAIFGGAFNPPHLGHQLISQQVLGFTLTDEVWLTPCFKHTFNKNLIPSQKRLAMVKMIINHKIKCCSAEIDQQLNGETIELMAFLKKKYSQHQFSFIIGSDNLVHFKKWGQWQKLARETQIYVFPRPKFDYNLKKYCLDNPSYQFKLIQHPLLVKTNLSSTIVRKRIQEKMNIKQLVSPLIYEYIKKKNLYVETA